MQNVEDLIQIIIVDALEKQKGLFKNLEEFIWNYEVWKSSLKKQENSFKSIKKIIEKL